jgi:hypothetical protein
LVWRKAVVDVVVVVVVVVVDERSLEARRSEG